MPTLQEITIQLLTFRPWAFQGYTQLHVHSFDLHLEMGMKAVQYRAFVESQTGDREDYPVIIHFYKVRFSDDPYPDYLGPIPEPGGRRKRDVVYFQKPSMSRNPVAMKCECFTEDTLIPLADGYSVPIKDLVGKKEFFVYSYDREQNKIAIGRGHDCELKRRLSRIVKIFLDNGEFVRCTSDHQFLLKDGSYRRADKLLPGDSLMPLYRRLSTRKFLADYEEVSDGSKWWFTHHLADKNAEKIESGMVRHHQDFNRRNNRPDNIGRMIREEHTQLHMVGENNPMKDPTIREKVVTTKTIQGDYKQSSLRMKENNPMRNPEVLARMMATCKEKGLYDGMGYRFRAKDPEVRAKVSKTRKERIANGSIDISRSLAAANEVNRKAIANGTYHLQSQNRGKNHKVLRVEDAGFADTYCFSVDEYENFAIDVDNGKGLSSGVFVSNCRDFRYRFEKELYDIKSMVGNWRRYHFPHGHRVRPPVNPEEIPGFCKHLYSFTQTLLNSDLLEA